MPRNDITADLLREHFNYNPNTGELFRVRSKTPDKPVGWLAPDGYLVATFLGNRYLNHRLIWLWWYGKWPKHSVDHINRDKADNRIENLREATHAENLQNQRRRGYSRTNGPNCRKPWIVRIRTNGVSKTVGMYATEAEAHEAYLAAKREQHPFFSVEDSVVAANDTNVESRR